MHHDIPINPDPDAYKNENWMYFRQSENRILILNQYDPTRHYASKSSIPWANVMAEIPIHHWLLKSKHFAPQLEMQLMSASLIALAPHLLVQSQVLSARIELLEAENELLKDILARSMARPNKTGLKAFSAK